MHTKCKINKRSQPVMVIYGAQGYTWACISHHHLQGYRPDCPPRCTAQLTGRVGQCYQATLPSYYQYSNMGEIVERF